MRYELHYWPSIQGRGEYVRLALEDAGVAYADIAQQGEDVATRIITCELGSKTLKHLPFAPPYLKAGKLVIGQTANILLFLGDHHHLAPRGEAGRLWTHQLQLTLADLIAEAHDTHHPVSPSLYYQDQKAEARRRADDFIARRIPKFMAYFDTVLKRNDSGYLVGRTRSYADLSLFQVVAGLRYAFPKAMRRVEKSHARITALYERIAQRPRIAAYLGSPRRIAFNEQGIFRHYKELDRAR